MAYINVEQWTSDQVVDWLRGLVNDDSMSRYVESFANNHISGDKLLNMRPYILQELGVSKIGHQEIILEAVEHLKNFHYNLDKENLQYLALQVATAARNLSNKLAPAKDNQSRIDTETLKDITNMIGKIKPLICWLDRSPFKGQLQYIETRERMLRLALEMAICAQRDRFACDPVIQTFKNATKLAEICDYIIQDISDPMLLQPASLILVTLKKKESDLGFYVSPSFHGIYKVTEIKFNSPAHISGKIEEGDEVVQINYQTVVGWQHKKVLLQLGESKPDVLLTLKKRPKHIKIYGQIYMKPYRLPSKNRSMHYRWGDANASPRAAELLSFQAFPLPRRLVAKSNKIKSATLETSPIDTTDSVSPKDVAAKKQASMSDDSDSDLLTPTEPKPMGKELDILLQTTRPFLQRRNTICGDQTESIKYLSNVKFWQKQRKDKSLSMGYGLEKSETAFLLTTNGNLNGSMPDMGKEITDGSRGTTPNCQVNATTNTNNPNNDDEDNSNSKHCDNNRPPVPMRTPKMSTSEDMNEGPPVIIREGVSKVVRFGATTIPSDDDSINNKYTFNIENMVRETLEPIPFVDDEEDGNGAGDDTIKYAPHVPERSDIVEAINYKVIRPPNVQPSKRVPNEMDTPPAIEPRKEHLQQTPPAPPPRPKKPPEMSPLANVGNDSPPKELNQSTKGPASFKPFLEEPPSTPTETLELLTPVKQKSLTLKKKNSILAKRRKIGVKTLQHSDIQGHLYRRTKDKTGTSYWAKGYFVLVDSALYCFRTKDAAKADFLIFLSGFTVCLASEIHSKPFAFKVYHALKTLYFAAESQEALSQWMDYLRQATMKGSTGGQLPPLKEINDIKQIFTETESSENESEGEERAGSESPSIVVKQEKYHLGLGSLKKFTKSNFPFTSSSKNGHAGEERKNSDLPIPSAQFRSYKKVQGFAGLSAGNHFFADLPVPDSNPPHTPPPLPVHVEKTTKPIMPIGQTSGNSPKEVVVKESNAMPLTPQTTLNKGIASHSIEIPKRQASPMKKPQPHNYIHASNPNLVDFDCHNTLNGGRNRLDFSPPLVSKGVSTWGEGGSGTGNGAVAAGSHSLQGFMTLRDLMLQQQAEDAKEVYNNRVFLGREKKDDKKQQRKAASRSESNRDKEHLLKITYGDSSNKFDKIQSRSLPKTPDYAQSFKPDDVDIIMIRSKEGQTLRNFGYEFISEEDPIDGGRERMRSRHTDKVSPSTSWSRRKGLNWINNATDKNIHEEIRHHRIMGGGNGSFKKTVKVATLKTSSDKIFSFNRALVASHSNGDGGSRKSPNSPNQPLTSPLTPIMALPQMAKKTTFFGIGTSSNEHSRKGSTGLPNDCKENQMAQQQPRKMSVPERGTTSYFPKLSFAGTKTSVPAGVSGVGGVVTKERKIFGSPRLHRAIFGKQHANQNPGNRSPLFDEISLSTVASSIDSRRESLVLTEKETGDGGRVYGGGGGQVQQDYYPNMECPPVFQPETYSLSNPSTSNTIRRRNNLNKNT